MNIVLKLWIKLEICNKYIINLFQVVLNLSSMV